MMTDVRLDNALNAIVDACLPAGEEKVGLWIRLDFRVRNEKLVRWNDEIVPRASGEEAAQAACAAMPDGLDEDDYPWVEDLEASADIHLLVYRPTNYTQIFGLVNDDWNLPPANADWLLYMDHDSCWRTDGWRLVDEVRNQLRKAVTPEWAKDDMMPRDVWFTCSIARVEKVSMSSVGRHTDPYDPKHRRQVTFLKLKKD